MAGPVVIVWDCGATNYRAVAVDSVGKVLAEAKAENSSVKQADSPQQWRVWDIDAIFGDLCSLTRKVANQIDASAVKALTITTWGADGAPMAGDGTLRYPLTSWQCPRTNELADRVKTMVDPQEIFTRTGYQVMSFNTILKLMWLRENAPESLEKMHAFVMVPGILTHRLTGEFSIDPTMAGTSMAFDAQNRCWDAKMLGLAGVDDGIFPRQYEPGQVIGAVLSSVADKTGLPAGVPVTAGGHDTQFALYGSGASLDQAVLSSGTWEILMVRAKAFEPSKQAFESGILIEQDASAGLVNPQFLMMASGALEWLRKMVWSGQDSSYENMTRQAEAVSPGSDGVVFLPSFVAESGPSAKYGTPGSIVGLGVNTTRGQVHRAALEGLSMQLKQALDVFSQTIGWDAKGVCIVGGGSRNALWNQIRADVTQLPIIVTEHKEATVLGAAMFALVGAGEFDSIQEAQETIDVRKTVVEPGSDVGAYADMYCRYVKLAENVGKAYKT